MRLNLPLFVFIFSFWPFPWTRAQDTPKTFNTSQICKVSDCNAGPSCQRGFTALTVTPDTPTQPKYQCEGDQYREVCCPSSAVPQGCTWRGTAPFCGGVCQDGEVTIMQDNDGDGSHCVTGTKVLCCPETIQQDVLGMCQWSGTAPFCQGACPSSGSGLTNKVTVGSGGSGNGASCVTGTKALCCPNPSPHQGCEWIGTAPFCSGVCPDGKVMLYSDTSGDGRGCVTGQKAYCNTCFEGDVVSPAIVQLGNDLKDFAANPSCDASQEPYNRRSLQDARKRNTGAHQATRHFRRLLAHLSHHNDETNESIATRASGGVSDPTTLSRIVDVLYPLLAALYVNNGNPNIGADQLAESEAFGNASANLWGGVSLQAWSSRLHYTQQDNYASDGPPDPRGDVLDMICEGPDSNAITLAMLVLENSVCLPSTCDATPSVCSGNPARRELEVSTDENEGGNVDDKLFKRTFDQKSTGAGPGGNGEKPTLYTVINNIIANNLPLLEFSYFNSGPTGSPDIQLEVVLDIGGNTGVAEYDASTQPAGWTVARDPDRVVVIHFHFATPTCGVSTSGKRIQIKAINMWHGQHAGVGINSPSVTYIEVGGKDKQKNKNKGQWGANLRFQVLNCPASDTWSVEDCPNPAPAQALDPKGNPLNLKGDNKDRLTLVAQLIQWLIQQNILVWDDGLDFMWDPNTGGWWDDPSHRRGPPRGPGGGAGGALNRGPSALTSF